MFLNSISYFSFYFLEVGTIFQYVAHFLLIASFYLEVSQEVSLHNRPGNFSSEIILPVQLGRILLSLEGISPFLWPEWETHLTVQQLYQILFPVLLSV